jgi:vanillate O-demethylase ferredoxin subunit
LPFEIEIASTGRRFQVPPGRSILEVLREDGGIAVDSSCEQGLCGTCATGVLAGEPDHRDYVLTESQKAENRTMMLCVSRAKSPCLVLDL